MKACDTTSFNIYLILFLINLINIDYIIYMDNLFCDFASVALCRYSSERSIWMISNIYTVYY